MIYQVLDMALAQKSRSKKLDIQPGLNSIILTSTSYVIIQIHQMTRVMTYMLLSFHGHLMISHTFAPLKPIYRNQ
jgi:hypothetical protein